VPLEKPRERPSSSEASGVSRRSVLVGAAAAVVGLGLEAAGCRFGAARKRGLIVGPGRFLHTDTGKMSYVLCLFDLDASRSRTVDMEFFGHGFAPHPIETARAVIFEKKGPGCCEVDLLAARVTRPITTPPSRAFYGHGAFSRDGAVLFATENRLETKDGLISVRDAKSYKELAEFPTYGKSPHDCHLIDEGKTLVITNGGGPVEDEAGRPSVTFVETASNKLLERLVIENPLLNAGHLALTRNRDLVAVSAPRDGLPKTARGGVTMRSGQGRFATVSKPEEILARMIGESLSVCIDEPSSVVAVTNPDGNIVTFWDLKSEGFVKKLDLTTPRGLTKTLDGEQMVLSYGTGTLAFIDPKRLETTPVPGFAPAPVTGSHLFTWDLTA
jgi:hypothetical protein